eukprot:CAMPEP_0197872596 /NCGR_PEP_ID=MMETSP1439-20131203/2657_1 /TAXON_ID=66791 /ORGANISM="Gonyaulax spinifera, Strain CCMP409" /LENGTH=55 /DNA_ID=CAMNT_0043491597 /DNA_START=65 /DNA_END=228 /DNA_ORIENTATION=+
MARTRSPILALAACAVFAHLCPAPAFVAPPRSAPAGLEIDARLAAASFAGLAPLA